MIGCAQQFCYWISEQEAVFQRAKIMLIFTFSLIVQILREDEYC